MYKFIYFIFFIVFFNRILGVNTVPPIIDIKNNTENIIIIDPGHGGGDWGINFRGIYEKDITYKIAKLIKKKILDTNNNINVYLTREENEYKNIEERVIFANTKKGNLFISIHCEFLKNSLISGYKIYFMDGEEIKKEIALDLILWKDVHKFHILESKKLAEILSQYMNARLINENSKITGNEDDDVLPFINRGIDKRFLIQLKGLNMPGVLIEICNLNNAEDFENVKNQKVLESIAYHIKEGIINFLNNR